MQSIDFILDTLRHFVHQTKGPPPGVPAQTEAEFERELMWLCEWHALTPIVLASLEQLALRPRVSRITLERMKALASAARRLGEDLLTTTTSLSAALAERGIDALFLNDVILPHAVYPAADLRPVERIEMLVREGDWRAVVDCCSANGFRVQSARPVFADGNVALHYYQYYAPCVLENAGGDRLCLRLRLFDLGDTHDSEAAWQKQFVLREGPDAIRAVSLEDQLIQSCLTYNITCFDRLLHAVDIGLLLSRFGRELDWAYVEDRLRSGSVYAAVFFTLENVTRWLGLSRAFINLPAPGILRRRLFRLVWHADYDTFLARRVGRSHRLRFCLLEVGGWREKLRFLLRLISPRAEWVAAFFGRPSRPWLKLKFIVLALRGRVGVRGT